MKFIKKIASVSWTTVFSTLSTFAIRFLLFVLFLFLVVVIFRGLRQDGYTLQSFEVPKSFEDSGHKGKVIANMLLNEVEEVKQYAKTRKQDSLNVTFDVRPDLNLDVMGVGLSASSVIYHLKELLGRKNYSISGYMTDMDNEISLTILMTDYPPQTFTNSYVENQRKDALDKTILDGALGILRQMDPYRIAIYHYHEENWEESENIIRDIIKNRPIDRKWAYHLWGNLLMNREKTENAIVHYKNSIQIDSTFILPYRALAWIYFQEEEFEEALKYFNKALSIDPYEQSMDTGAALCYRRMGDVEKAEEHYESFIEKHPKVIWAYGNYSDFLMNVKKDSIKAANVWDRASKNLEISGDYYMALAAFQYMSGNQDLAVEQAYKALELEPKNVSALNQLARYYLSDIKDYDKAVEIFVRLISAYEEGQYDDNMKLHAYNRLAIAYYMLNDIKNSLRTVEYAIEIDPANPLPHSTKAEAYLIQGDIEKFYEHISTSIAQGFFVENFYDEYPYNLIEDNSRLNRLREKYKTEQALKG